MPTKPSDVHQTGGTPEPLRARAVRFWPGAIADQQGEDLGAHLTSESEWLHEREWRVAADLVFGWDDVEFLIVPDISWQSRYVEDIRAMASPLGDLVGDQVTRLFSRRFLLS